MKHIITILIIASSLKAVGQSKSGNINNTHIDKANKVNIYLNKKVIIGKIVVLPQIAENEKINPTVYLENVTRTEDTSGVITRLAFKNPGHPILNDIKIILTFDKPVISADVEYLSGEMVFWGLNETKLGYNFQAQTFKTQEFFYITVKSLKPVFITISGLDFVSTQ